MPLVVTGLSQNGDVTALHKALEEAGLPTDPLQVIGPDASSDETTSSARVVGAELLTGDEPNGGLLTSSGGTAVPGLSVAHQSTEYFRDESLADRLGDLEIPDSELDNYLEALERGRSVVVYFAHAGTIDRVEELFRAANLGNVRRF